MPFDPNKPYVIRPASFDPARPYTAGAPPKASIVDQVAGALANVNRSIPFADEAGDLVGAGLLMAEGQAKTPGEAWARQRARSKALATDFQTDHPVAANLAKGLGIAAQVAPAILSGGATAAPTLAGGTRAVVAPARGLMAASARALSRAAPVARNAVAGALAADVNGIADEGTLDERLKAGSDAAPTGAVLGVAIPALAGAVGKGWRLGARMFSPPPAQDAALTTAGRILADRVPDAPLGATGPGEVPFESMGRGGKSLARAVANVPGPGQEIAERVLSERRAMAPGRMLGSLRRDLGGDGANFHDVLDNLDKVRKVEAKPLYEDAWSVGPVDSTVLRDLERRGSVQAARRSAFALAREEGVDPQGLGLGHVEHPDAWVNDIPPDDAALAAAAKVSGRGGARPPSRGPSLMKFVADNGGLADGQGEMAAIDAQNWHKGRAFQRKAVGEGSADDLALRAWEAGYFPELQRRPTERELFDALGQEMRGKPRFAREADQAALDRAAMHDQADEMLYRGGFDGGPSPDDYVGRPEPRMEPAHELQPTMQAWDYIKRSLDDIVEGYKDPLTGRYNFDERGHAINNTLRALNGELRSLNPTYAQAQDAYSGPSKTMDAVRRGRRIVSGKYDPEVIDQMTGRMSRNERDGHLVGLARGASDQILKNPQAFVRKVMQDGVFRAQMRAGFPDDATFEAFLGDMSTEAAHQKSYNDVLMGSRTTPLREDIDAANAAGEGADLSQRVIDSAAQRIKGETFRSQAARGFLRMAERARSPALNNPEVSRILAEVLFTGRPASEVMERAVAQKRLTRQEAELLGPIIAQATGTMVGVNHAQPVN